MTSVERNDIRPVHDSRHTPPPGIVGFAAGVVAAVLVPVIQLIRRELRKF